MTVPKIDPVNNYAGNGSTTTFDFDFLIESTSELLVQHTNNTGVQTTLVYDTDYTINAVGNENGSYITFPKAGSTYSTLESDEILSITPNLDIEQEKEIRNSGKLNLAVMEWCLDYITRILQVHSRKIERSVKIQEGSSQTADELVEALQQAQVNASASAASAASSAINASGSSTSASQFASNAEDSYNNTVSKYDEVVLLVAAEKQAIEALSLNEQSEITTLGNSTKAGVQALGIYMEDNRLFYFDENGVKHEFRNDFGGIAPMSVKHKDIQKVAEGFAITWTDPDDSSYEENVYCTWGKTVIVRKLGSYPESPFDGDIVLTETVRNAYSEDAYIDEVDNTQNYKYRAFPCSINNVYSVDNKNKFGVWVYAFEENDLEATSAKRITYLEDNKFFKENKMNFTSGEFDFGDWENSPFYHLDYIRPCMLYNDAAGAGLAGTVMEYLDPNDHSKTIAGTASHYSDQACNANAMVEKRKIFLKVENIDTNKARYYFSNEKLDEDYECYPCLKADGTYSEFYYTPIEDGSLVSGKLRSLGGNLTPISANTAAQEITYARANGAGWDTEIWGDIVYEELIFRLTFKNTDSQSVLGQGKSNGGSDVSACLKSGTMSTKGINWGSTSTADGVKYRYRSNFYASQWQRFRGLIYINGVPYVKMTKHTGDGSTATDYNLDGIGYIPLTVTAATGTSGGYISKTVTTKYGAFSTVVSGSSSTYLCDGRWFNNSGTMYPFRGGDSSCGSLCGAFCLGSNAAASAAAWSVGAALSYHPL